MSDYIKILKPLRKNNKFMRSKLLTAKQAAEFLGVSLSSLRRYIRYDDLPARFLGTRRTYRFSLYDLEAWTRFGCEFSKCTEPQKREIRDEYIYKNS